MGLLTEISNQKTKNDFENRKNANSRSFGAQQCELPGKQKSEISNFENRNSEIQKTEIKKPKIKIDGPCQNCKSVYFWVQRITGTIRCMTCKPPPTLALAERLVGLFATRENADLEIDSQTRIVILEVDRAGKILIPQSELRRIKSLGISKHELVDVDVTDYETDESQSIIHVSMAMLNGR